MKKRHQGGVAPVETVLILVIVALVAFVAWYAFHVKSNTDSTLNNTPNSQSVPKQSATANKSTPANTSTASQIVVTKTDSKGAKYLADGNGKTLYTYGADTTGVSNCTGSCLSTWPIYKATSTTSLPANVTIITRSDGGTQYAYKGMPLYYYVGDTAAGQINGNGVNNFSVAKP